MKVKNILNYLCDIAPIDTACDFDNVGLLVGDVDSEVSKCIISLDCTKQTVENALNFGAQLIITHHPVIFNPLKNILSDSVVFQLIKNGISVISMHTNLDMAYGGVNDVLAKKLNLKNITSVISNDGFVFRMGELKNTYTADTFAEYVKNIFGIPIKYSGANSVKKVAVCSGSGAEFLFCAKQNGADALVTSECKHHLFNAAAESDIVLVDAGHYDTEDIIVDALLKMLKSNFSQIDFKADHSTYIKFCL